MKAKDQRSNLLPLSPLSVKETNKAFKGLKTRCIAPTSTSEERTTSGNKSHAGALVLCSIFVARCTSKVLKVFEVPLVTIFNVYSVSRKSLFLRVAARLFVDRFETRFVGQPAGRSFPLLMGADNCRVVSDKFKEAIYEAKAIENSNLSVCGTTQLPFIRSMIMELVTHIIHTHKA